VDITCNLANLTRLELPGYEFNIAEGKGIFILEPEMVIKGIVNDLQRKIAIPVISLRFHNTVCNMVKKLCILLRNNYKINKICLSGGVFQNRYLNSHIHSILERQRFVVYSHNRAPTHDGGIALGQAVLAGV
jgi:hydrogenase maturation protein HypF